MIIKSVNNEKVQLLKKLAMRKYRRLFNLFILEGQNIVKDIPKESAIHSLYIKESKKEDYAEYIDKASCPVYVLSDRVFDSVSDTVTPSGILAVLPITINKDLTKLTEKAILLEGISDSGNLGTIIRTAAAFGYTNVVLINTADVYSGKTVRSSMGGVLRVQLYEGDYEQINSLDHEIYVLDMKGSDISDIRDVCKKHLLVVGNEAHGVSEVLKKSAKRILSIKMQEGMESLNVAVSASIGMYMLSNK